MVVWVFAFVLFPHPKELRVGIVIPGKPPARKAALEVIAEVLDMRAARRSVPVLGIVQVEPDLHDLAMISK